MTDKPEIDFGHFSYKVTSERADTPEPKICPVCNLSIEIPGEYYISVYDSMAGKTIYYHYLCYTKNLGYSEIITYR
uniref:Uncharacterized protein n=1 Tax=Dictyoglomus turgidum TaxID=513050 RepID=A0A7C3WMB6_9BACT